MTTIDSGRARSPWIGRAVAALVALVLGVGFAGLAASTAQALPSVAFAVSFNPGSVSLTTADDPIRLTATIKNTNPREASDGATGTVTLAGVNDHVDVMIDGGDCGGGGNGFDCGVVDRGAAKTVGIVISPKIGSTLPEGQTVSGTVTITMGNPNSGSGSASISVTGSKQTATGVQGNVTAVETGEPIPEVAVAIKDSKGGTFTATTDGAGNFALLNVPVAAGETEITFTKEGFAETKQTYQAVAGQMLQADIRMEEATAEDEATEEPTTEAPAPAPKEDEGLGAMMWVLIILGALLVIGGIVAIVMLFRRGKDDDDDEGPLPDVQPIHRPSATQTGQLGVYDAARHRPGMDAPTMIHNGPLIADGDLAQYGSPPPSQGFGPSYDQPTSGGGFGPSYDNPTSGGGFGPSYDDRRSTQRFDAPRDETRRQPRQDDDYGRRGDDRGGWGGGHDQRDPYPSQRDPYDQSPPARDPYGQAPPPRDPYDQQPRRRYRDEDDGDQDQRHRW